MKKLLLIMLLSILVFSCERDDGVLVPTEELNIEIRAKKDKVQICHKLGNGQFKLIEVNGNAVQAHLNHGDGKPGMCYDEDGLFMNSECTLIPVSEVVDGCDGLDNNCNGTIDEGVEEICNGVDDDCDELIDEGFDQDGDGVTICEGDCDDLDTNNYPGNVEDCTDGFDNDCDSIIDCEDSDCGEKDECQTCDEACVFCEEFEIFEFDPDNPFDAFNQSFEVEENNFVCGTITRFDAEIEDFELGDHSGRIRSWGYHCENRDIYSGVTFYGWVDQVTGESKQGSVNVVDQESYDLALHCYYEIIRIAEQLGYETGD